MSDFSLNTSLRKSDIIEKYRELLDAYQNTGKELEEKRRELSKKEQQLQQKALELGGDVSVKGVLDGLNQLRALFGETINDLTEKMSAKAEELEGLERAISIEQRKLKELYDLEGATDSFEKLVAGYTEQAEKLELEHSERLTRLERAFNERHEELEQKEQERIAELEREYEEREKRLKEKGVQTKEALTKEIHNARAAWEEENTAHEKAWEVHQQQRETERRREEAEYTYNLKHQRKLEEDGYALKRSELERELKELKERTERELDLREEAIAGREQELATLNKIVEGHPMVVQKAVNEAVAKATEGLRREHDHQAALTKMEREWEQKTFEQADGHLKEVIAEQKVKIEELKKELTRALTQVEKIANKAIEGASQSRAYESVNRIALEQARTNDSFSSKE